VTAGTNFHHTHLPLQKWLLAVSLVLNTKERLSARQLRRDLDVKLNTGWRMAMRIRKAIAERDQRELLTGVVEVNEVISAASHARAGRLFAMQTRQRARLEFYNRNQ
jgi:hypothetical protein